MTVDWCTNTVQIGDFSWDGSNQRQKPEFLLSAIQFSRAVQDSKVEVFATFVKFDNQQVQMVKMDSLPPSIQEQVERYKDIFPEDLPKGLPPDCPENIGFKIEGEGKIPL